MDVWLVDGGTNNGRMLTFDFGCVGVNESLAFGDADVRGPVAMETHSNSR